MYSTPLRLGAGRARSCRWVPSPRTPFSSWLLCRPSPILFSPKKLLKGPTGVCRCCSMAFLSCHCCWCLGLARAALFVQQHRLLTAPKSDNKKKGNNPPICLKTETCRRQRPAGLWTRPCCSTRTLKGAKYGHKSQRDVPKVSRARCFVRLDTYKSVDDRHDSFLVRLRFLSRRSSGL